MLKNITGSGISRDHTVKIWPHQGATTVDMIDYVKPELRHKPDIIILHSGTNDIINDVKTVEKMKKLVEEIEKNNGSTEIVISGLIKRFDRNAIDDIERINEKLKRWCIGKGLTFIDNNNINESCLNRGKLHLNRRGSSYLANNFKKFIESLWESKSSAKVYINSHKHLKTELNDLRSLRIQNPRNIIFSYLNINSIRYKFDNLKTIINENLDILCIAESKIDKSFTTAQFMLPGYQKPYRLDISDRKGGLLVYIKSHLPSRLLKNFDIPSNIQIIPFELNLRKEKWMFMCIYRPPSQNKQYFLEKLSEIIDHFSSIYDNYIILGDFNMEPSDSILKTFMQSHNLFNLSNQTHILTEVVLA